VTSTHEASECGIRVAASATSDSDAAIAELKETFTADDIAGVQHILVFFSLNHDAAKLAAGLALAFPGVPVSGCSTAGELAPSGMIDGGIILIAFPKDGFRILSGVIEPIDRVGVEQVAEIVRGLKSKIGPGRSGARPDAGPQSHADGARVFSLLLVDGLSKSEEQVVAAVHWAMDDVQLIGGSSGDSLNFERTALIHDGRALRDAAILLMIETDHPFRVFKTQNFEPTTTKLVVTSADTENRIVHELNAEPAAREYATAIGLLPDDLGPFSFASYPLVVKVGGDYYCRSIRNLNPDGSLTFFCAIDEGLVFTVASPQDMLAATRTTLEEIDQTLGGIDMVLGFDCILRRLDAQNRQISHQFDALYRKYRIVGFNTYGEQFNAMHLNQTLTGIAFGRRAKVSEPADV